MQKSAPNEPARLPERDARVLAFEGRQWGHSGAKEEAIRVELGMSATRYYQLLNAVIDTPAALRFDPMLVRRLSARRQGRGASAGVDTTPPLTRQTQD